MSAAPRDRAWYRYWAAPAAVARETNESAGPATAPAASDVARETNEPEEPASASTAPDVARGTVAPAPEWLPPQRSRGWDGELDEGTATPELSLPEEPEAAAVPRPGGGAPRLQRARVLAVANQKGGVGKTTTAVSLAAALAEYRCRVLLIDLDPQGNATSGVGVRPQPGQPTIYDVLVEGADIVDAIEPTSVRNLFIVPATLDLAGAEIELVSAFSREQKLRRAVEPIRSDFDVVLVDCPPSLGLLTVNALSAGDGVLVPIQCEYYALEGLGALRRNAELIRDQLNPQLDMTGFILTMHDARTRLSQQVVDEVKAHFGERVFTTRIPRSVRLAEAPGFGQPITVFDPSSRGAMAYRRLALELIERLLAAEPNADPGNDLGTADQGAAVS